jgi:hypothetical protein
MFGPPDIEKIDIPVAAEPLDMSARVRLPQSGAGPLQLRELTLELSKV